MKNALSERRRAVAAERTARRKTLWGNIKRDRYLILIALGPVFFIVLFCYVPMFGVFYGFQDVNLRGEFWTNEWLGITHLVEFLDGFYVKRLIKNTSIISFWSLVGGTLANIGLALLFNEIRDGKFKRISQSLTFFPNFLSTAIVVYMLINMFLPGQGILSNTIMKWLGQENVDIFSKPSLFQPIYILSGIWQGAGWGSIIYLGAINGIDPTLYEAAAIDGVGRLQRIWHITLPGMKVVTMILLISAIGGLLSVGHAKIILMYRPETYETADVISTYVYREGLSGGNFGMATCIGLFNSVISLILLLTANWGSKKLTDVSMF